jgi:DNA-binding beta-propeller fold protein YncE
VPRESPAADRVGEARQRDGGRSKQQAGRLGEVEEERRLCFVGMMVFCAISLIAQTPAPAQTAAGSGEALTPQQLNARAKAYNVGQIPYESVANFIKLPTGMYLGESMGVATNSKGHVFVFNRNGESSRLYEFDQNGTFVHEIGRRSYAFAMAHAVRVDAQDNIWTVDEGTNMVTKFSPDGKVLMVLGRRPPAIGGAVATRTGPNPPAEKYIFCRPTDVGWDPQGNIFVSDGYCNNRIVKYDPQGRFLAQAGSEKPGKALGEFSLPHGMQVDGKGNVWVADRSNFRYQVLDNNLKPIREITNLGVGWTMCISPGPHQYVFHSNSNPNGNVPGSWDITGEIYKTELDGTVIGKFGRPGKLAPNFQVVHMMDCRDPNQIIVGEIESWRVQKLILKQQTAKAATAQ